MAAHGMAGCDGASNADAAGGGSSSPGTAGSTATAAGSGGSAGASIAGSGEAGVGAAGRAAAGSAAAGAGGTSGMGGSLAPMASNACDWSACGGEVVGAWRITELCNSHVGGGTVEADCGVVSQTDDKTVGAEGTLTFLADGTFEYDWTKTFEHTVTVWESCFAMAGIASCDEVSTFSFDDCTDVTCEDCTCTGTCAPRKTGSIPWTRNGNSLALDCAAASDPTQCQRSVEVCVTGDTMMFQWQAATVLATRE
jgi:hypothetical protein